MHRMHFILRIISAKWANRAFVEKGYLLYFASCINPSNFKTTVVVVCMPTDCYRLMLIYIKIHRTKSDLNTKQLLINTTGHTIIQIWKIEILDFMHQPATPLLDVILVLPQFDCTTGQGMFQRHHPGSLKWQTKCVASAHFPGLFWKLAPELN